MPLTASGEGFFRETYKMPLLSGKKNIGKNIENEQKIGKPHDQSVAIALNVARKSGAKIPKAPSVSNASKRNNEYR